jgi:hypothetical protein
VCARVINGKATKNTPARVRACAYVCVCVSGECVHVCVCACTGARVLAAQPRAVTSSIDSPAATTDISAWMPPAARRAPSPTNTHRR